ADLTSITAYNLFGDIEAEPRPLRSRFRHPKKLFKDSLLILLGDSRTGVGDRKAHGAIEDLGAECDVAALGSVSHRVTDKVREYMSDALVIGQHLRVGQGNLGLEVYPFTIRFRPVCVECRGDKSRDFTRQRIKLD